MFGKLEPRRAFHFQECHKCHGRGRYKCSGCHGAGMVSPAWVAAGVNDRVGRGSPLGRRAGLGRPGAPPLTV